MRLDRSGSLLAVAWAVRRPLPYGLRHRCPAPTSAFGGSGVTLIGQYHTGQYHTGQYHTGQYHTGQYHTG
ncbi:MAG: hypothetical protein KDA90_22360, partial [Planctomycetaceae bacterium]|nr:hypothetical protein [Planctomycetaceae bacterium]